MAKLLSRTDRRLLAKERKRLIRRNERRQRMGLVSKMTPERRDVPDEEGAWMAFLPLTGEQFEEAQTRSLERTMRMEISAGMSQALLKAPQGDQKERPLTLRDVDKATLVRYGIVDWGGGGYDSMPCDPERKKLLTGRAFTWAAEQIFELSYVTVGEASRSEQSGTNGAGPTESSEPSGSPSQTPANVSEPS
jgi:hypothetical protein